VVAPCQRQDGDLGRRRRADLQPPQARARRDGDQAAYIGPIGAGTIAKLVHNCTSAVMGVALAEVFTMGIKAGVEPLELWEAVRQGATGRQRTFDRLGRFLSSQHDSADFALRLLHKDVGLAVGLGREVGVPMRLANMAYKELTEAMNRGWDP
jgi:3-hydroxyisobutyrate dehydrogenase